MPMTQWHVVGLRAKDARLCRASFGAAGRISSLVRTSVSSSVSRVAAPLPHHVPRGAEESAQSRGLGRGDAGHMPRPPALSAEAPGLP